MEKKFMDLLLYGFLIFVGSIGGFKFNNYIRNKQEKEILSNQLSKQQIKIPSEFISSNDEKIVNFEKLKALKKFIETVDLEKYDKDKILREVDYALSYAESKMYEKLGKKAYEKEFNERKCDLSIQASRN